jgi:hypothetical protein
VCINGRYHGFLKSLLNMRPFHSLAAEVGGTAYSTITALRNSAYAMWKQNTRMKSINGGEW